MICIGYKKASFCLIKFSIAFMLKERVLMSEKFQKGADIIDGLDGPFAFVSINDFTRCLLKFQS